MAIITGTDCKTVFSSMRIVIGQLDCSHANCLWPALILHKRYIMNIIIESPHIEASQVPETLIRRKFNHLERFYDRIESCKVVLHKEKNDVQNSYIIEAVIKVPDNLLFSSDASDAYEIALDKVIHNLEKQLHRYKEKLYEKR